MRQPRTSGRAARILIKGAWQLNPYATNTSESPYNNNYEMQDYNNQGQGSNAYGQEQSRQPLSQADFLSRVGDLRNDIKSLTTEIDYIGQLHQRTLSTTDPEATQQLEHYVAQTQIRNTAIKDGIKGLERDLLKTTDASRTTKKTQLESLKTFFKSELDKYQSIERDYQQRYREQIARQYRIVNPDASEDEVQQATEADWNNEGVFQTAVSFPLFRISSKMPQRQRIGLVSRFFSSNQVVACFGECIKV